MADINVERKRTGLWPLLLIGLFLVGLALWSVYQWLDTDDPVVAAAETEPVAGAPLATEVHDSAAVAAMPGAVILPVSAILAAPSSYGAPLGGEATVTGVPTDRGFWIEENGQRMFVVIDEPKPEIKNIQEGQRVAIQQARVYPSANAASIPGELDADTRGIIQGVPAVLYVQARNIRILSPAGS